MEPSEPAQNAPRNAAPGSGGPPRAIGMTVDSSEWLGFVVQNFSEIVMLIDPDGTLAYASPAFERLLAYDPGEASGKNLLDFVHPDDLSGIREETERVISGGDSAGPKALEYRIRHKDGSWRWMEGGVARVNDPALRGIVLNARDITERKEAEERYRTLVEQIPVVAYIDRADGTDAPLYTSPQIEGLLGYNQEEASHSRLWRERLHLADRERMLASDERFKKEGEERFREEYRLLTKDDSVVWVLEDAVLVKDATTGTPLYWQGILYDITERKEAEEWLEHRAFHDPLTDLPNRQLVHDRLDHALARTERSGGGVTVLFIDLDRFKVVNDSLGHEAGDLLLVAASERFEGCLRPEDTLARFGGDEFVVLVEDLERPEQAIHVAERLIECLEDPFVLEGRELFVRASVGIAFGKGLTKSADDLLRDADTAMYRAKYEGLDYALFSPGLYEQAVRRLELENDLRRAVERKELVLYYQPIFEFGSKKVWGVEALVRWKHPERGLMLPAEFIALAEETGLIVPIGRWVLHEACRRTKGWQESYSRGGAPLRVIVNLSATQLRHPEGEESIREALAVSGLGAESLRLDVTEGAFIDALEGDALLLERIENLGVGICIDDFGTGYSSLSYLKMLPANVLKIDKSFVKGIEENDEDTAIVGMVVDLAHTLGMKVIAEGVETDGQDALLEELGCDMAQGLHFERAVPPGAVSKILLSR